ncbi:hypothetical protein AJ79_08177 [Helicocarpus griseus UAMH5409]|uniref:Velvet domain-containing protein n=1 Tax=Helicocarpus griseus UAMH5409 TaxID=1447875 RepID=A0A2B7WMI4_9EURO|nr:hypothetical protein AJ79_08177 [Helicocarpus griseus UAMH5409]
MATKSAILHPHNETEHSISRVTKGGRTITYVLKVIQQPERARACGAGAKSSADRRPVDPPPVVELRIFESDLNDQHRTDITFGYNASFFLYTKLDFARPIAHGRSQNPACAVLTGVPVAGIAYLDRPTQAGYFIFPDLSVRHEGYYRLTFTLYEQTKDPKDADKDEPVPPPQSFVPTSPSKPRSPAEFMHARLAVKTVPFTVYSAKKFPGLAESTSLSRIVAEQGCRVRIRRDVRMRRREHKANKDYGAYDERHITPDPYPGTPIERPRSASNVSIDDHYRYPAAPPRVQPAPEYGYPQPPHQPSPISTTAQRSHLSFGVAQPQYHAPPPPPSAHPAPPPPAAYPSPHLGYAHARQLSAGSEYDPRAQKYAQYPSSSPHSDVYDQTKSNIPMTPSSMEPPSYAPISYDQRPADAKLYMAPAQIHPAPSPRPTARLPATPNRVSIEIDPSTLSAPPMEAEDPQFSAVRRKGGWILNEKPAPMKRTRDTYDQDQPLRNGQRPISRDDRPGQIGENSGSDDEIMTYRRADGRLVAKHRVSVHSKGKEVNIPKDVNLLKRRPEMCAVAE